MSYAVVTFTNHCDETEEGCSSSEVPMVWLCENNTKCWWPTHSKNIGSLITRKVPPNKERWTLEAVKVEMFQVSLEKARKLAANLEYESTDDAEKGRGKRKIIPPTKLFSTSDEDLESPISSKNWRQFTNIGLPPQLGTASVYSCSIQSPLIAEDASATTLDIQNMPTVFVDVQSNLEQDDIHLIAEEPHEMPKEKDANMNCMNNQSNLLDEQSTARNITVAISSLLEEHLLKLSRMFILINLQLKNIDKRLTDLEHNKKLDNTAEQEEVLKMVKEFLPLRCTDQIASFERIINSNEGIAINFKKYIQGVGGNGARDNLYRILKRIFTNECAEQCSWLGRKNNFAIHNLTIMTMIKETICTTFTLKENDFEKATSEWFRFAKQRHNREK